LFLGNLPGFNHSVLPIPPKVDYYSKFLYGRTFKGKRLLHTLKNQLVADPPPLNITDINKKAAIEILKEGDYDIFHPTYYDSYFLDYIGSKPFVLTVYDLIHQVFPEFGLYEKRDKTHRMLDRADAVLAISESTKNDLVTLFNVPEEKITVTHLANSLQQDEVEVPNDFKNALPEAYILFVGMRGIYKNFLFFVQVFAALQRQHKNLHVVCAGTTFNQAENYQFQKLGIANYMHSMFVSDAELTYLYKHAVAFIFPSMYEGFGIPVLEAFSCGCPVLLSRTSSFPEVAGNAGIYFDPKNAVSMLAALQIVITDNTLRQQKIAEGYTQEKKFSWQTTGNQTIEVYKRLIFQK
jgi:glycosyltransferase involved in cell wall biosynthesis